LRREPDGLDAVHVRDRGQDAADPLHVHAARVRLRHRPLPRRSRPVLGDDEPVDGRSGADHPAADAEDAASRSLQANVAYTAEGRRGRQRREAGRARRAEDGRFTPGRAAAQGAPEEGHGAQAMTNVTVEATGETVGEAKWAALRELELRHPGLDKSAVQFEVVSEGERGLLGVGYAPARVVAHLPAEAAEAVDFDERDLASEVRLLVSRIVAALGVDGRVDVREDDETITATCSGADVALLIGRHGQTIDAVQYLLNA